MNQVLEKGQLRVQPKQQRAKDKVDNILDATARLLDENGVGPLNTSMIAKEANMAAGTVYHYFPNKIAILTSLAERTVTKVDQQIQSYLEDRDFNGERSWTNVVRYIFDCYKAEPGYVAMLQALSATPELADLAEESNQRMALFISIVLKSELPEVTGERIAILSRIMSESIEASIQLALRSEDDEFSDTVIEELESIIMCLKENYK